MLIILVDRTKVYDEETQTFGYVGGVEIQLEHSLVSLSKWESIHTKPFLSKDKKTPEEILSYVECMLLTQNPPENFLYTLLEEDFTAINDHIESKKTATWFSAPQTRRNVETITSELVYYWMTVFNIPFECENWHLNRLFTLIQICNEKQAKPKRMNRAEAAQRQRELNARRKAELGTKG